MTLERLNPGDLPTPRGYLPAPASKLTGVQALAQPEYLVEV
jgi:hypothetical protein